MTTTVPIESIVSKIVFIRDEKVMLDRDLAELYGVETGALNRAVKRNTERFPEDFMFQVWRGGRSFEMPNWHLKAWAWWAPLFALCLYGTRSRYVVICSQ